MSAIFYESDSSIRAFGDIEVHGNGNQIEQDSSLASDSDIISVDGSNNQIHLAGGKLITTTGSIIRTANGITLSGSAVPGSMSLINGHLTVQLGDGNVVTIDDVASGDVVKYTNASGAVLSSTTLRDKNLVSMGTATYEIKSDLKVHMSSTHFIAKGDFFVDLVGSNDRVTFQGGGQLRISGDKNSISTRDTTFITGDGGTNNKYSLQGAGSRINVGGTDSLVLTTSRCEVNVGDNAIVMTGDDCTIFAGDNSDVYVGVNCTVSAGLNSWLTSCEGGAYFNALQGTEIDGDNNKISSWGDVAVYGDNNSITAHDYGTVKGNVVTLAGANNQIRLSLGGSVVTATSSIIDGLDGLVVLTGHADASDVTLVNGLLSVQLGDGNVATVDHFASGLQIEYINDAGIASWFTVQDTGSTPWTGGQNLGAAAPVGSAQSAHALVSAMASYDSNAGAVSTASANQSSNDSMFQATLVAA